jgi:hypothetical protein
MKLFTLLPMLTFLGPATAERLVWPKNWNTLFDVVNQIPTAISARNSYWYYLDENGTRWSKDFLLADPAKFIPGIYTHDFEAALQDLEKYLAGIHTKNGQYDISELFGEN